MRTFTRSITHAESEPLSHRLKRFLARSGKYTFMIEQTTRWPKGFQDIGGLTFQQTWDQRPEWVDFTLTEMKDPSGMFKEWKSFCVEKKKQDDRNAKERRRTTR